MEHLGVDVIDSYLLHGPTLRSGLGAADWEAWRAMEAGLGGASFEDAAALLWDLRSIKSEADKAMHG